MNEREVSIEILNRLNIPVSNKNKFTTRCINPAHNDVHPSMDITLSINGNGPGYCKCWSCGYSKTLREVYKERTGRYINQDLNMKTENLTRKVKSEVDFDKTPEADFVFNGRTMPLQDVDVGREWIKKRGLTDKVVQEHDIKYCSFGLTKNKKYPNDESCWTYFTDRAIIPIYEGDTLLSLEGRDLRGEEHFNERCNGKYRYTKVICLNESKMMTLYQYTNLDKTKRLFLTEGILDVLSLKTDEFFQTENVSCIFRNKPSERQLFLL